MLTVISSNSSLFPLPTGMIRLRLAARERQFPIPLTYGDDPLKAWEDDDSDDYSPYLRG